jgi:hypothetical protein
MTLGDGIRRNIANVEPSERALLRDAFKELNNKKFPGTRNDFPIPGGVTWWFKQDEIHQATHVHNGPEFVPWHREIVNRLEEMLRQINPQLSLHYWDWTQDPTNIPNANLGGGTTGTLNLFTSDFMGYGGSSSQSIGEPWLQAKYYVPGANPDRITSGNPADPPGNVTRFVAGLPLAASRDTEILDAADYEAMRVPLEKAHNDMHNFVNMGGQHVSFRDPFVFLLHSNVDRLFAKWQAALAHSERLDPKRMYVSSGTSPAVLDNSIAPWAGQPATVRPWAPPENDQQVKTYKTPCVVAPPFFDTDPAGGFVTKAGVMWNNGKAYFFRGKHYYRYDVAADKVDSGYPATIAGNWPDLWTEDIDAAVMWNNGKAYFFKGSDYVRYDISDDKVDSGYPKPIAGNWPDLWTEDIDAAVMWNNGKAYFFKGSEYMRYDVSDDKVDSGYPKPIAGNWPGLWTDRIDSAVMWSNGKAYFFKGRQYMRYDVSGDKVDSGYPAFIVGNWPGLR